MKKNNGAAVILLSLVVSIAWLDPYADEVSKGNKNYADKKYPDAVENYNKAGEHAPGDDEKKKLNFNRGAALQQSGDADKAAAEYRKALELNDPEIQKRALYNLGGMHLKAGREKEAFESYKAALKIDPNYEKAKKNIEYMIKKKEKQKGDNNQQDKNQSGKDRQSPQQKKENGDNNNSKQDKAQQGNENRMSPEEAKAALEAMKKNPVRRQKGSGKGARYLEKFW